MSGAAPPAAEKRPWWVPLLAMGSIGLGGIQGLGGIALLFVGLQVRGESSGVFLLGAAAWIVPGLALAAGGVGILAGARWGRWVSVAAVGAGLVASSAVALRRTDIPPAVADAVEYASNRPDAKGSLADLLVRLRRRPEGDLVATLRDPDQREMQSAAFAVECACPALPWYAVLLVACLPAWGRRMVKEG